MSSQPRGPVLMAPGRSGVSAYAPGRDALLPAVDDRLIAPESHAQIIDGAVIRTMGANPPHATRHADVTLVFAGALAPGYEWDHAAEGWTTLAPTDAITDRCFSVSIPVAALIDRVLADDVVARALLASRNGVIERALAARESSGEARGEARGRAAMLLRILAKRGVAVDESTAARVLACEDVSTLEAWFDRATTATRAGEVFGEG